MKAVVIGAGLDLLDLPKGESRAISTPFGRPSVSPLAVPWRGQKVWVLPRHGKGHSILPHRVNYRANLWALRDVGVTQVIAVHSVGTMNTRVPPGDVSLPSQLIDYTYGRASSFDGYEGLPKHVELDPPFDAQLQTLLVEAASLAGVHLTSGGVYGVTQGPRLETAAEVDRLERAGCDLVGMTALPEAALARELDLPYVSCAVAVNHAAGRQPEGGSIHEQLAAYSREGFAKVQRLLDALLGQTPSQQAR